MRGRLLFTPFKPLADQFSMLHLSELESAADLVHTVLAPTPQIAWPLLAERCGAEVWVKHENHLPTGAFKVRGGLVYMADLAERQPKVSGVITATRGKPRSEHRFRRQTDGHTCHDCRSPRE